MEVSGTHSLDGSTVGETDNNTGTEVIGTSTSDVDWDVIARDLTLGGHFARIDAHGTFASPCSFWGMTTPSG